MSSGRWDWPLPASNYRRGDLAFDRVRLSAYLVLLTLVLVGSAASFMLTLPFNVPLSLASLVQFMGLTAFGTLSFTRTVDEAQFFRVVNACFAVVAVAGIVQFAVQFAGLSVFAFGDYLPAAITNEGAYNNRIPIGSTPYFKSNGFFLAEPSIMSQFMAFALIIEVLVLRRPLWIGLFVVGLVVSLSGTGWLVLGTFLLVAAIGMGRRGVVLAGAVGVVLALAMGLLALAFPDAFEAFVTRTEEFGVIGSSGHLRFVTPFWAAADISAKAPWAWLVGIGAGVSERLWFPYGYSTNTPIKLALEFGVPALLAYVAVLACGRRSGHQALLVLPGLVLLLFAGSNQQFAPVLFPVMWVMSVAALSDRPGQQEALA